MRHATGAAYACANKWMLCIPHSFSSLYLLLQVVPVPSFARMQLSSFLTLYPSCSQVPVTVLFGPHANEDLAAATTQHEEAGRTEEVQPYALRQLVR